MPARTQFLNSLFGGFLFLGWDFSPLHTHVLDSPFCDAFNFTRAFRAFKSVLKHTKDHSLWYPWWAHYENVKQKLYQHWSLRTSLFTFSKKKMPIYHYPLFPIYEPISCFWQYISPSFIVTEFFSQYLLMKNLVKGVWKWKLHYIFSLSFIDSDIYIFFQRNVWCGQLQFPLIEKILPSLL